MTRPRLLYIAVEFPYPPRSGFTLKEWHMASRLGDVADVTLITLLNPSEAPTDAAVAVVRSRVRQLHMVRQGRPRILAAVSRLQPPFTQRFATREARQLVARITSAETFDVVHLDCVGSTSLLADIARRPRTVVASPNDAYALIVERRGRAGAAMRLAEQVNVRLVRRYERAVYGACDQVHFVSAVDCEYAQRHYPEAHVHRVPLGIEIPPLPGAPEDPCSLVFVANMLEGHGASIADFVRYTLPLVHARIPGVRLWIVGAHPPDAVRRAAADNPLITVTGWVDDVQPYIDRAAIALSLNPLPGGMQTKALAPMASGKVVVGLPQNFVAIEGAIDGKHYVSARTPEEFASAISDLLASPERRHRIGQAARQLVRDRYTWDAVLDRYKSLVFR